jgi:hypothetical protein
VSDGGSKKPMTLLVVLVLALCALGSLLALSGSARSLDATPVYQGF